VKQEQLTGQIIGAAMAVLNELKAYQAARGLTTAL